MIVLMGSGETSPTMVELHKSLLGSPGRVTILDTPYGFQENADELSSRAVTYFNDSVGVPADVVSLRSASSPAHEIGVALAALGEARYVFSGPGSPTYALRQWRAVGIGDVFARVVEAGGVVCLASAASVCAGEKSLPVYEVYKVGIAPYWEDGIDLLGRFGIRTTVVPHFNNAEGGTHDTSCCWVGRRRLEALRREQPDLPVLGIDEHTALVIDPATKLGTVHGQGGVHTHRGEEVAHHRSGDTVDLAAELAPAVLKVGLEVGLEVGTASGHEKTDLASAIRNHDADSVVEALSTDVDLATAIAPLAEVLRRGWADHDVALLLEARAVARADKQWAVSDLLRDGLAALGVVVEDTEAGQRVREP